MIPCKPDGNPHPEINVLVAGSACVADVTRLASDVDLLYASDGTYSIIKVGLGKGVP